MKFWQQFTDLKSPEPDEGGGGQTPEQKAAQEARDEANRIKLKNQELLDENKKIKDQLKNFEGLDPTRMKNLLAKFEGDEELKLISEGKFEDVIKKRTERVSSEFKSQIDNLVNENTTNKTELAKANEKIQVLLIDNNAVTSFIKSGGLDTAADDVKLRAKEVFKVESGEAIARDAKGEIVRGKNGPMTMEEWVESLKETAPHLFSESSGAELGKGKNKTGVVGIDKKIADAAAAGNVEEYKRLKKIKAEQQKKKE